MLTWFVAQLVSMAGVAESSTSELDVKPDIEVDITVENLVYSEETVQKEKAVTVTVERMLQVPSESVMPAEQETLVLKHVKVWGTHAGCFNRKHYT